MSLQFVPRARVWAQSPDFAASFFALQRAVFDETPALWEAPPDGTPALGRGEQRVLRLAQAPARIDRYHARLARTLAQLMTALDWPTLHLLGLDRRAAWDGDPRTAVPAYPPLARARARLLAAGMPAGFKGALVFAPADCALVVPAWFWAARCGAAPYDLQLGVPGQALMGELCQHGNLHLSVDDPALLARIDSAAVACGLVQITAPCQEAFGTGGAIPGRNLRM